YIIFAFGQSVLRTVLNSEIIGMSDAKRRGEVSGVLASLMSLSAIIGPIFAGLLYELNMLYPMYISFVLSLICAGILYYNRHEIKDISDISKIERESTSF
ncbi:MAG: MFS transporter, partial [bacterium]